ncbi:IS110 family transposase [Rhodococcus sp. CSLK01-03]|uniref:IS110 family transposase n=1 Tax=Rhodococcus indonesiensis TaxID=3055869 RepID=A0ABT7RVU8_9NOCA|nr:IS110 family transposase [Rhodococcus indonesiensis]MDM7491701.1 IS110 family transposase [Rhodococcus indonesiensis]
MTETPAAVSLTVYAGIDTHKHTHHVALVDALGRRRGDREFPTTATGHRQLLAWITGGGTVARVGIEGTGSYGASVATTLRTAGLEVVEVDRPDRRARRTHGKSDPLDAYAAATAALTGRASTVPKTHDGDVEAIRFLRNARRSAVKARAEALTQLQATVVTAPEPVRDRLRPLSPTALTTTCAGLRPGPVVPGDPTAAVETALRSLARRILDLTDEERTLHAHLEALVAHTAPDLLDRMGIGVETAAQLLITVGDNPHRIRTEAAFAHLCGAAPIPASSGRTHRHRLHRGGDRQANRALYIIVITRLAHDRRTRDYAARRTAEGKTRREIIRCLKRAVAREVFRLLTTTGDPTSP